MGKYIGEKDTRIIHMNRPAAERCAEVDKIIDEDRPRKEFDALHMASGYKICDKCEMS